jgi:tetratricopeptide (TPR) repeat protein/predicted Ser/Thr protein kinase
VKNKARGEQPPPPPGRSAALAATDPGSLRVRMSTTAGMRSRRADGDLGGTRPMPAAPPSRVGDFRILREIGRGGMGTVFEAEQGNPRRRVALKIIHPSVLCRAALDRFQFEAEALGRLRHPAIPHIYEAGEADGVYFFAMELIDGEPLTHYGEDHSPPLEERIELVASVCDAVHHAHLHGVVHLDLKPSNIMITRDGQVKVLDFGISRSIRGELGWDERQNTEELVLGTPAFMSPEHLALGPSGVDVRSDVFSIGVIGYFVLSGRIPFAVDGMEFHEAAKVVQVTVPPKLGAFDPSLAGDVEAVIDRAIQHDPTQRYHSAAELAVDLRRHLASEPVSARPHTLAYLLGKFVGRHRTMVALLVTLFFVLMGGVLVAWNNYLDAQEARRVEAVARQEAQFKANLAEKETAKAQAISDFLVDILRAADPDRARGEEVSVREVLDAAAARLDGGALAADPDVEPYIRRVLADSYRSIGKDLEAERHLESALAMFDNGKVSASPLLGAILSDMGDHAYRRGDFEQALAYGRQAYTFDKSLDPPPRAQIAKDLQRIGIVKRAKGDIRGAIDSLREAVVEHDAISPSHPAPADFSTALNELASTLTDLGRFEEAERLHRRALEIDQAYFGPTHTEVATDYCHLATLSLRRGRPAEGLALADSCLRLRRDVMDPTHPEIALALVCRAALLQDLGRFDDAGRDLDEAILALNSRFGPKHRATQEALASLASLRLAEERAAEALSIVDGIESDLPHDVALDPWRRSRLVSLRARAEAGLGRHDAAERLLLDAHRALSDQIGVDHPKTREVAAHLRELYERWGKPTLAARWSTLGLADDGPSSLPATLFESARP